MGGLHCGGPGSRTVTAAPGPRGRAGWAAGAGRLGGLTSRRPMVMRTSGALSVSGAAAWRSRPAGGRVGMIAIGRWTGWCVTIAVGGGGGGGDLSGVRGCSPSSRAMSLSRSAAAGCRLSAGRTAAGAGSGRGGTGSCSTVAGPATAGRAVDGADRSGAMAGGAPSGRAMRGGWLAAGVGVSAARREAGAVFPTTGAGRAGSAAGSPRRTVFGAKPGGAVEAEIGGLSWLAVPVMGKSAAGGA
jgi:hypothetical protein